MALDSPPHFTVYLPGYAMVHTPAWYSFEMQHVASALPGSYLANKAVMFGRWFGELGEALPAEQDRIDFDQNPDSGCGHTVAGIAATADII